MPSSIEIGPVVREKKSKMLKVSGQTEDRQSVLEFSTLVN